MNWLWCGLGVMGALFVLSAFMNLAWGTDIERRDAKDSLVQLAYGVAMVVILVLTAVFVITPALSWFSSQLYYMVT